MATINELEGKINALKEYLNNTDYQVLREQEGGEKMSIEVKTARAKAREDINIIQKEIEVLKEQEENEPPIVHLID